MEGGNAVELRAFFRIGPEALGETWNFEAFG
jgi:hypothetical protein